MIAYLDFASYHNTAVIDQLLCTGVDIDHESKGMMTAFLVASLNCNRATPAVFDMLIEAGSDPQDKCCDDWNAFHYLADYAGAGN